MSLAEGKKLEVAELKLVGETRSTALGFFVRVENVLFAHGGRRVRITLLQRVAGDERRIVHLDVVRALIGELADLLDAADTRTEDWQDPR